MAKVRIQKFISQSGLLSRRAAERAIAEGRVKLNGRTLLTMGEQVDESVDRVELDGKRVRNESERITFAFYKPRNVLSTRKDPHGRKTIMDYFKKFSGHFPVGRLDYASEGLILVTNDGEFANIISHPRFEILKQYEVDLNSPLTRVQMDSLCQGIKLEDGEGKFLNIEPVIAKDKYRYRISVGEGRNRFIRRMMECFDKNVIRLKRTRIGSLHLGDLKPGDRIEIKNSQVTSERTL